MNATRKMGALAATLLVASALTLPAFAVADSTSVTVSFRINPSVSVQVVDGGLLIHSNAPWVLVAAAAGEDGDTVAIREMGPATGSAGIRIEADGLVDYALTLDATR